MLADDFYRTMMEKLTRKPFKPFAVEMIDGSRVPIEGPKKVSIRGGLAAVSTRDCFYVRVDCDDVREIVDTPVNSNATI